jgi:hypothetical protein
MNAEPKNSPSGLAVVFGLLFIGTWIAAHVAWASLSFMGSIMANDSSAATQNEHVSLISGLLAGQVLACVAGLPAGLAFFWRRARKGLLISFAVLFSIGASWQVVAYMNFTQAAAQR